MKIKDIREQTVEKLKEELVATRREQLSLRLQQATSQGVKPHLFRVARRKVARIKMVLGERGIKL